MDLFSLLALCVVVVVGLGLGATTTIDNFRDSLSKPSAVVIGFCSQYVFMPLIAFALANIFDLKESYAIGLILTGSSPGGSTSNVFTYWSKGNVALSITMSFFSTLAACFMLPILILVLIKTAYGSTMEVPWANIIIAVLLILFPCLLGLYTRHNNTEFRICGKLIWEWMELFTTVFGVLFFAGALLVAIVVNGEKTFGAPATLWVCAILMEPLGALFGYFAGHFQGLSRKDCRTIGIETGVQNFVLTMAIVSLSFEGEERDDVMLFPLIYGFCYIVNSLWIILLLRYVIAPLDGPEEEEGYDAASKDDKLDNLEEGKKKEVQLVAVVPEENNLVA